MILTLKDVTFWQLFSGSLFPLFFVAAPLKWSSQKRVPFFSRVTEQLSSGSKQVKPATVEHIASPIGKMHADVRDVGSGDYKQKMEDNFCHSLCACSCLGIGFLLGIQMHALDANMLGSRTQGSARKLERRPTRLRKARFFFS